MKLSRKDARRLGLPLVSGKKRPKDGLTGANGTIGGITHKEFSALCVFHKIPEPIFEYRFSEPLGRRHRFDALLAGWLALECQGGLFTGGRHVRGAALVGEYEKLNLAVILGYSVLFCIPQQIKDGSIFPVLRAALAAEGEQA